MGCLGKFVDHSETVAQRPAPDLVGRSMPTQLCGLDVVYWRLPFGYANLYPGPVHVHISPTKSDYQLLRQYAVHVQHLGFSSQPVCRHVRKLRSHDRRAAVFFRVRESHRSVDVAICAKSAMFANGLESDSPCCKTVLCRNCAHVSTSRVNQ